MCIRDRPGTSRLVARCHTHWSTEPPIIAIIFVNCGTFLLDFLILYDQLTKLMPISNCHAGIICGLITVVVVTINQMFLWTIICFVG